MKYSIGVDLGGTNLRIAAVDDRARLLEKVTLGTQVALGRARVLEDMCEGIRLLGAKYAGGADLQGIGIGVPGILDISTGMLRESPNLPGWEDYPVRSEIENRLNTRVFLENDANCAAFGEKWLGAGRDVDDLAMLTLGTGVGGGIVLGGQIWHGMTGMAGEFGHMTIFPEGVPCKCGNRGCLEQYASATAVVRMAREGVDGSTEASGGTMADPELSAKAVHGAARQGDKAAQRIFATVGYALGIAVAAMVNGLNLPMYVIGGGVSAAWDQFSPAMFEELRRRSMVYAATAPATNATEKKRTMVMPAQLGGDSGLFGAARLALVHALPGASA